MDAQRRAEVTGWDAQEFSEGFAGLHRLVDREFSGAVTDGAGWLFVFEGRVIGAVDADLDAFADASGTAYRAPHESLPILFAMQEQGGEPRAQYYTNDTPLSEADRKLSQGGFTGYVELSENVLSGDYYVTYTAGESMSAAYVGNSRRLETGDDAFALADDEVGIYTVYEVDLSVREIPTVTDDGSGDSAPAEADNNDGADGAEPNRNHEATGRAERSGESRQRSENSGSMQPGTAESTTADRSAAAESTGSNDDETERDAPAEVPTSPPSGTDGSDSGVEASQDDSAETTTATGSSGRSADSSGRSADSSGRNTDESSVARSGGSQAAHTGSAADPERSTNDDVFSEEAEWREQRSIPALDPSEASDPADDRSASSDGAKQGGKSNRSQSRSSGRRGSRQPGDATEADADSASPDPRSTERRGASQSAVSQRSRDAASGGRTERVQQLESALEAAESERESLTAERDKLAAERDELRSERDDLAADLDRLETEVSSLREERNRLREELSDARDQLPESERTLSPAEARSGTNLFIRYDSKGGATLADAHDGSVDRDELKENLRIEHHTSFETDGMVVDGRPYGEFLTNTIEYGFTRWLVEDLPFEVSETGNQSVLRDLYDSLPEIDRAEIGGSISIIIRENGEETREQRAFDLVLRDRMGNPLFVADLNDSRDPTAEGTLESLVENGRDIAESNDSFAGAFAVTESFFEPGALETASDAVGGGLFSRSKRSSFVKLSRKQGYHLCLVEARDGGFHMTVPDL